MRGIFVDAGRPCNDAGNAYIMSYWGGNNGLNVSQVSCTIKRMTRQGSAYTLKRTCVDMNDQKSSDTARLVIKNPSSFSLDGVSYRWCSKSMQAQ